MNAPWFHDPNTFGALYGSIVGGVGGTLIGLLGAAAGVCVTRGAGRTLIPALFAVVLVFGLAQLAVGLVAVTTGQPYGIWYPFVLCGAGMTFLGGLLYAGVKKGYQAAEQRRIDAAAIRSS